MNEPVEIPISKTKLTILLIGAGVFVAAGLLIAIEPTNFISRLFNNEQVIRISGIASALFFGICFVFITRKLFNNKIGLRIDETGITDNSSAVSIGLINWNDITDVGTYQVYSTKFIVLGTDQPNKYINKATNGLMKKALQANNRMCGSPITINSNSLKIKHQNLEQLIFNRWNEHVRNDTTQKPD